MTDCSIPFTSTDVFFKPILAKTDTVQDRLAFAGTIELTPHCNLKCAHCYIANCQWEGQILSYSEICRIFDEAVEEGCMLALLTGGEPLLRKDFFDIYTYVKKKGILTTVFTNATMVTPDIARFFHEWPPTLIEVSVYGATRATYESVTGVPGSFDRCMKGIELLLEQGIHLNLKSMLMSLNKHEYWEIKNLAKSFGVNFRFDPILNPRLDGSQRPCQLRLSPEEVVKFDVEDPDRNRALTKSYEDLHTIHPRTDTVFSCGAGWHQFFIDAFGKLQPCLMARQATYDLRKGTFHEAWRDFLPSVILKKLDKPSPCRACHYRYTCAVCPGWVQLEYGTSEVRPIEYLCELEHLRAKHFDATEIVTNVKPDTELTRS